MGRVRSERRRGPRLRLHRLHAPVEVLQSSNSEFRKVPKLWSFIFHIFSVENTKTRDLGSLPLAQPVDDAEVDEEEPEDA